MKFSSKVEKCGLSPMRKFHPYAVAAEKRGVSIYHLNIGQPDVQTPPAFFKAIKEFVIAIDTSASCRGDLVQAFLQKTYSIMQQSENFFNKINVHIIQCDSEVQQDIKITQREDLETFMRQGKLTGFGATDFRPVFAYVEKLKEEKEFDNLKGLIYFTDGYGIYPESMPDYEVAFVFLQDDVNTPKVPNWAIKLVLEEEDIEAYAQE